jgi:Abortive infection alpha
VVDPIVTPLVIVGAGTWFANKLLGPSADELGQQLKLFASNRLGKILGRSEEIAEGSDDLKSLPPAYIYKFVQSASLSEDDPLLTEMWANLLVESSENYSHKHLLFVDILEKLNSSDVILLDKLIPNVHSFDEKTNLQWKIRVIRDQCWAVASHIAACNNITHFHIENADEFNRKITELKFAWPCVVLSSRIPYIPEKAENGPDVSEVGLAIDSSVYDALIRQRLAESFNETFIVGFSMDVGGVVATSLAVEFVKSCRGKPKPTNFP